jgi:hypothetical protein
MKSAGRSWLSIHRKRLKGICRAFKHTVIAFELDKNENTLSFVLGEENETSFQLPVEWCPMLEEPLSSPFLYELPDIDLLKRAIYYVTPMSMCGRASGRAPVPQFPGVQFATAPPLAAIREGYRNSIRRPCPTASSICLDRKFGISGPFSAD